MSATRGKQDGPRVRLEVLPGGRTDDDAAGADWQGFCERIGWQQLTEPVLADDYEDRLVAKLFAPADGQLVSLEAERLRRRGGPALFLAHAAQQPVVAPRRESAELRGLGWQLAAVAVFALLVAGAALLVWRGGEAPPAANTVPTPVPERAPSPATPVPESPVPESPAPEPRVEQPLPDREPPAPDPGLRIVERRQAPTPAPRARPTDRLVAKVTRPAAATPAGADPVGRRPAVAYRISPESGPTARALPLPSQPSHLWVPVEAALPPTIRLASQPAGGRAPTWHHLAMAPGRTGAQSMALVDLRELDRRLSEAL